ncbi:MAG TPA: STAS domain-containing protein [Candidatus Micrarchaeaceae archaeon]|nr:STAS domain-containing protein [Candidatus Micrarchaeaceae archaeon]
MPNRVLKQGDYLIGIIGETSTDAQLASFATTLGDEVGRHRSRAVIVDVGELKVIDSFTARMLSQIATTVSLRGARPVVVGIQPEVAFAMVRLGLHLDRVATALDLDAGLELVDARFQHAG